MGRCGLAWSLTMVLGACSSGSSVVTDAGFVEGRETYSGLLAGPYGETGVLEVSVPVAVAANGLRTAALPGGAVRGALVLNTSLGPITLSGHVDASGSAVTFEGTTLTNLGSFTCTGSLVDRSLRGRCTGADGKARDFDSRVMGVDPIERYCGFFEDEARTIQGAFNLLTAKTYASAVFSSPATSGVAVGTLSAKDLVLTIVPDGTVSGHVDGAELSGSWTLPGVGTGPFRGTTHDCPRTAGLADASVPDFGAADGHSSDSAAGIPDSGAPSDAASEEDSGALDSGTADAGAPGDGAVDH